MKSSCEYHRLAFIDPAMRFKSNFVKKLTDLFGWQFLFLQFHFILLNLFAFYVLSEGAKRQRTGKETAS